MAAHLGKLGVQLDLKHDALVPDLGLEEPQDLLHRVVEREVLERRTFRPSEIQERVGDLGDASRLDFDLFQSLPPRIVGGHVVQEQLRVAGNPRERRIHLMSDPCREQP